MAFLDHFALKDTKEKTHFNSYWVHTIVQFVIVAFLVFQENKHIVFALILLMSNTIFVIVYVSFQFPITGFLSVWVHRLKEKYMAEAGLFPQIFFSVFVFVLLISSLLAVIFTLFGFFYVEGLVLYEVLGLVFLYFLPVFFVGELFRQRFILKKIYAADTSKKTNINE